MKPKKNIEEQDLDALLNRLFLEKHAGAINDNSARFILQQEYDVKIDAGKEKELIHQLKTGAKGGGGYFNFLVIIIAAVIGGTGILCYHFYSKPVTTVSVYSKKNYHVPAGSPLNQAEQVKTPSLPSIKNGTSPFAPDSSRSEKAGTKTNLKFTATGISVYFPLSGVGSTSAATFFKPTEQDFIFYGRVKHKMLEKLMGSSKETCTAVEGGEMQYRNKALMLYPFILRNQAVTNLEYKIFLAELIKSGKTESFKKAIVRNETWINYNNNILATTYFFDEKYNDFPVVNISAEAAFLFCDWLEKEINLFSQQANTGTAPLKIRLPFDSELLFATAKGHMQIPDCKGYNTIYDIKEGLTGSIKKRKKITKTVLDDLFSINRYRMDEDQTLRLFEKGFGHKDQLVADSLYPNRMSVFSKAAHVSEIIQEQGTGHTLVAGSCWKDKRTYTDMLKEFNKAAASPFVGFRFVILEDHKAGDKAAF